MARSPRTHPSPAAASRWPGPRPRRSPHGAAVRRAGHCQALRRPRGAADTWTCASNPASSSPSWAAAAAARARCCGWWPGWRRPRPAASRSTASDAPACTAKTSASCSRTRACCPGTACSTTWRWACRAAAQARAAEVLAQVGLADRAARLAGACSRAASASAWRWPARWCTTPRLLLLDEPLGALDALTRIEMHRLIESLWQRHGFTALLVTHDVAGSRGGGRPRDPDRGQPHRARPAHRTCRGRATRNPAVRGRSRTDPEPRAAAAAGRQPAPRLGAPRFTAAHALRWAVGALVGAAGACGARAAGVARRVSPWPLRGLRRSATPAAAASCARAHPGWCPPPLAPA